MGEHTPSESSSYASSGLSATYVDLDWLTVHMYRLTWKQGYLVFLCIVYVRFPFSDLTTLNPVLKSSNSMSAFQEARNVIKGLVDESVSVDL